MNEEHATAAHAVKKPRRSVFLNLLFAMLAFGVAVGVLFPPFARAFLSLSATATMRFSLASVSIGLLIGCVNFKLFEVVVTRELGRVAHGMKRIGESVATAIDSGKSGRVSYRLEVTSSDLIGEVTDSFNDMSEAIGRRISMESTARRILADLSTSVELDDVSQKILEAIGSVCSARAGVLYGDIGNKQTLLSSFGVDQAGSLRKQLDVGQGLAFRAISTGEVIFLSTSEDGFDWMELSTPLGSFRPKSVLIAPMMTDRRVVGVAVMACVVEELSSAQRELLDTMRTQSAPYLQTAILHRKLRELAAIDDLTRVLNRRFGLRRLHEEFSRSVRYGVPLGVIMLDVDHFKDFNDMFGHDAGDTVLESVASIIESSVRSGDVVCRYGGDEFLIVAPGMGLSDVGDIAERLRRVVETTPVQRANQMLPVTVSLGAVTWPVVRGSTAEELVSYADKALYTAKEAGRNQVAIHRGDEVMSLEAWNEQNPKEAADSKRLAPTSSKTDES